MKVIDQHGKNLRHEEKDGVIKVWLNVEKDNIDLSDSMITKIKEVERARRYNTDSIFVKHNRETSKANDKYCNECMHLSITEKNQTDKSKYHICTKYGKRVKHNNEHPLLYKCDECLVNDRKEYGEEV